ncbi:hypothetical protein GCM10022221_74780 [Actinocorallia aurea]
MAHPSCSVRTSQKKSGTPRRRARLNAFGTVKIRSLVSKTSHLLNRPYRAVDRSPLTGSLQRADDGRYDALHIHRAVNSPVEDAGATSGTSRQSRVKKAIAL